MKIAKENSEESFYKEMDEKRSHNSCCTCQTMLLLFVVLFFVVGGLTYYLYYKISRVSVRNVAISKTKGSLLNVGKIKPDKQGNVEIALSEQDINNALEVGLSTQRLIIKELSTTIDKDGVFISGSLMKPLSSQIVIETYPKLENGKLKLDLNKLVAGELTIPNFLISDLNGTFQKLLDKKLEAVYASYDITNVALENNKLILAGKAKGR